MSQASKALKKIAASEEYKALDEAIKAANYEAIAKAYIQVRGLIEEERKQILDKIRTLPRQNKEDDCRQFETAFELRLGGELPKWHWLAQQLKEEGVMEGEVIGLGTHGDPMVRTPDGRMVVLSGALEKGTKVKFKVVTTGPKLDFGRVIEMSPDYFSFLLNREVRTGIKDAFDAAEACLRNRPQNFSEGGPEWLSQTLKALDAVREIAGKMEAAEKESTMGRVLAHRRRLLNEFGLRLAFDFMTREEEKEIAGTCPAEEARAARALAAPGLFRLQSHQALKARLLQGGEFKGYSTVLKDLESKVDTMHAAMKLMEFQSGVDTINPTAKAYLDRIDRLFDRLNRKAREVAVAIAEGSISSMEDIDAAVKAAFGGAALCAELRRSFRNAAEFNSMRAALAELMVMLGDSESAAAEAAVKPYLSLKISGAFGS